jgi:single-stranded DNA-binding protein
MAAMHLNRQILLGRIGARGVRLTYNSAGTPICTVPLETDKLGRDGKIYTSYHSCEITGRHAEQCAEELEPGAEICVEGEHQYRSVVDAKTGEKRTKCVLSTWGVSQRLPSSTSPQDARSGSDATPESSAAEIVEPQTPVKVRKPRYPKWKPEHAN